MRRNQLRQYRSAASSGSTSVSGSVSVRAVGGPVGAVLANRPSRVAPPAARAANTAFPIAAPRPIVDDYYPPRRAAPVDESVSAITFLTKAFRDIQPARRLERSSSLDFERLSEANQVPEASFQPITPDSRTRSGPWPQQKCLSSPVSRNIGCPATTMSTSPLIAPTVCDELAPSS